ncbi:MAG: hypothetical protein P1T08_06830 [Acidimicrobiia bacterium]|nr:hypothetical protein [Acidimicrobiia bacterium]
MRDLAGRATGNRRLGRRSKSSVAVGMSVILLAACTSNGEAVRDQPSLPPSDSSPLAPAPQQQPVSDDLGESSTAGGATVVLVESEEAIIEPGTVASFSTRSRLTGVLRLVAPAGSELIGPFVDGRAEIPVPDDSPEGEYLVIMEGEDGALGVGTFLVAAGPTVWLRSDRRSVGPADEVVARLDAHRVNDDALALFGWGDLDLASYVEGDGGEEGEPLGFLVPDGDGFLQPGYDPVPLQGLAGRSLLMSGMQVAGLQALVIDPEREEALYSNFLPRAGCAETSRLSGTIGGPGALRVLSTGDGLRSAGLITGDGTFSIDAPHGRLAAFGARDDGQQIEPLMFDIPCGAAAVVDLEHGDFEVTALEAQAPDVAEFPGDSGTLTFTGDIETEFLVEPFCDYRGSEIKIAFATYDPDVPAVLLFVDGGDTPDSYDGRLEIRDWSQGGAQSGGLAEIGVSYSPGALLAEGTFELDARYSGAAGDGAVTGNFTCTVLGLTTPAMSDQTVGPTEVTFDPLAVAPVSLFDARGPDPAVASPACRNLVIDDGGDHAAGTLLAATLRQELPRAAVATRSELDWLLSATAGGYLGPGRASEVAVAVAGAFPDLAIVANDDGETISLHIKPMSQEPRPVMFADAALGGEVGASGPPRDSSGPWTVTEPLQGVSRALADGVLCVDLDDI